ncbi:transferase family III [Trichoderma arundinaceum]|uniref:Transferase family III n=1 Tax=Trichoderma arundinaceum TaxID=490622 RepID=A0A395NVD0_TRIAR|nr:transferase family III [Trichoderma arundinaceum]
MAELQNSHSTHYSVPLESKNVFYEGTAKPSIPINWRLAESTAALKALEATAVNVLLKRKYNVSPQNVIINTDHAQLFLMSAFIWTIHYNGVDLTPFTATSDPEYLKAFPNKWDLHRFNVGLHRRLITNIYKTKDGRYYHTHGSINPDPSLDSLGLPHDREVKDYDEALKPFVDKVSLIDSVTLDDLENDKYKQSGTVCLSMDEYKNSEQGKANAHVGLFEIESVFLDTQPPCWWPDTPQTSPQRPLAGLKVLDLGRAIAVPTATRGLAELGASILRVTAAHVTDMVITLSEFGWGKWNCHLDFRKEEDRQRMRELVWEADVVVQGYRPGVLDKYGFSPEGLLDICKERERGLIVQISDASTGVSLQFGRAMGNNEPVSPFFPNSDIGTGVSGTIGILVALLKRGESGGSYRVDIALNYYSQWLVNSVGTYSHDVWDDLWTRNGKQIFRHYHDQFYTLEKYRSTLKNSSPHLWNPDFFENRYAYGYGKPIKTVKPIAQYRGGENTTGGSAKWPQEAWMLNLSEALKSPLSAISGLLSGDKVVNLRLIFRANVSVL